MIKGFAHIALYARNFDATIEFYQCAFGARQMGIFEADTRGCWLDVGGDILEIFEGNADCDGYFKHFAIACDDVDALYAKALECGAASHVEPKDIVLSLEDGPVHARIAFVKGPNGEQIELFDQKA